MLRTFILLIFISIFLAGCGFHPRGATTLPEPLKKIFIKTAEPYSSLTRNIQNYLKLSGAHLTDSPEQARTVLEIVNVSKYQVLTSISGTQQTRQYDLILTAIFQVTDPQGRILIPQQSVSEKRTITIQASQMLGSSNEANAMYQQMQPAVVSDIMSRLSADDVPQMLSKKYP